MHPSEPLSAPELSAFPRGAERLRGLCASGEAGWRGRAANSKEAVSAPSCTCAGPRRVRGPSPEAGRPFSSCGCGARSSLPLPADPRARRRGEGCPWRPLKGAIAWLSRGAAPAFSLRSPKNRGALSRKDPTLRSWKGRKGEEAGSRQCDVRETYVARLSGAQGKVFHLRLFPTTTLQSRLL